MTLLAQLDSFIYTSYNQKNFVADTKTAFRILTTIFDQNRSEHGTFDSSPLREVIRSKQKGLMEIVKALFINLNKDDIDFLYREPKFIESIVKLLADLATISEDNATFPHLAFKYEHNLYDCELILDLFSALYFLKRLKELPEDCKDLYKERAIMDYHDARLKSVAAIIDFDTLCSYIEQQGDLDEVKELYKSSGMATWPRNLNDSMWLEKQTKIYKRLFDHIYNMTLRGQSDQAELLMRRAFELKDEHMKLELKALIISLFKLINEKHTEISEEQIKSIISIFKVFYFEYLYLLKADDPGFSCIDCDPVVQILYQLAVVECKLITLDEKLAERRASDSSAASSNPQSMYGVISDEIEAIRKEIRAKVRLVFSEEIVRNPSIYQVLEAVFDKNILQRFEQILSEGSHGQAPEVVTMTPYFSSTM